MKQGPNPTVATIAVGVLAALLFLALQAATDGIDTTALISSIGVGIGGAVGYRIGVRRRERRARR